MSVLASALAVAACGGGDAGPPLVLGEDHRGQYHLGPVEWAGSFNNACSPYPASIQQLEGSLLAGVAVELGGDGSYCDACIQIDTDRGKSVIARVVTYGVSQAAGDLDVSQAVFDRIHEGEFPRMMTWRLVTCPVAEPLYLQFQTGAHEYWTSFWVRNSSVAVAGVEVVSANHAQPFALRRGPDGTFNDDSGFGRGAFTVTVTGIDGSRFEQRFDGFRGGDLLRASGNL